MDGAYIAKGDFTCVNPALPFHAKPLTLPLWLFYNACNLIHDG